jgi:hypothetical protein
MPTELNLTDLEADGWAVESWHYRGQDVTVLHREPFRLHWFATQLVTFVFIIDGVPKDYHAMLDDYAALRRYAGQHKQTLLPFGLQCGYAILPIYVGEGFSETQKAIVRSRISRKFSLRRGCRAIAHPGGRLAVGLRLSPVH